ncbi:MAG: hypothetical protein H3C54_07805 [Taibaiella sp.]|nr:hypothetical protein [Taibaiella sp.]
MEKAVVLHADILGFKNIVKQADAEGDGRIFKQLKTALEEGVGTTQQFQKLGIQAPIRYKLFSDNLYVAFPYQDGDLQSYSDAVLSCIAFARSYSAIMLDNQYYIRGGISSGMDYSDDTVIFSLGLVKAYELELQAIYPRILVDADIIERLKEGIETPGPAFRAVVNNSILKDKDGHYFLNPSGLSEELNVKAHGFEGRELNRAFLKRYYQNVQKICNDLKQEKNPDQKIIEKYAWLLQLLIWLYTNRENERCGVTRFNSLRFEEDKKNEPKK